MSSLAPETSQASILRGLTSLGFWLDRLVYASELRKFGVGLFFRPHFQMNFDGDVEAAVVAHQKRDPEEIKKYLDELRITYIDAIDTLIHQMLALSFTGFKDLLRYETFTDWFLKLATDASKYHQMQELLSKLRCQETYEKAIHDFRGALLQAIPDARIVPLSDDDAQEVARILEQNAANE